MDYTFSTPALVFSATSLLMLAYTNRFLTLSELIRNLHKRYIDSNKQDLSARGQIRNLSIRLKMIRWTQLFGAFAFALSVVAMLLFFVATPEVSLTVFIISLVALLISLGLLMGELQISVNAINIQLDEMKD
jgi:VIT1/CCC1 family predicted Fe2+/Mn2+ transporter